MMYAVAFVLPPLSLFLCGKPYSGVVNGIIWIIGCIFSLFGIGFALVIPCIIWAMAVVGSKGADMRQDRMIEALKE